MDLEQALAEIARLQSEAKKFEGIDPAAVQRDRQSLSEQLANTQRQFNEYKQTAEAEKTQLQGQLTQKDTGYHFRDALSAAGVLPEYRDRFNDVAAGLKFEGGKLKTSEGNDFDASSLRTTYPAMFAAVSDGAGSGAGGSNGAPAANAAKVIEAKNGIITGVEPSAILKGEVVIK
jgi:hypothetical protein